MPRIPAGIGIPPNTRITALHADGAADVAHVRQVERHTGALELPMEVFRVTMGLPEHCRVTSITFDDRRQVAIVYVEAPELPATLEGAYIPVVTMAQIQGYDG